MGLGIHPRARSGAGGRVWKPREKGEGSAGSQESYFHRCHHFTCIHRPLSQKAPA